MNHATREELTAEQRAREAMQHLKQMTNGFDVDVVEIAGTHAIAAAILAAETAARETALRDAEQVCRGRAGALEPQVTLGIVGDIYAAVRAEALGLADEIATLARSAAAAEAQPAGEGATLRVKGGE